MLQYGSGLPFDASFTMPVRIFWEKPVTE